LDENGQIVNEVITGQKVGIIDIGFQTTDYTVFDNLRYIDRGSTTMETGISKFFRVIAGKLQEKSGINVEPYRMYDAVENGIIKMRGQEYDISKIRDSVFSQAADIIAGDADRLWTDEWDIDTIILTGGGSMKLSKYLQPLIPGSVISSDEKTDARLNNVKGYLKYGKYIWDDSSLTLPAAEDKKDKKPAP
jgi:plasmid segregation protein ParM